MKRKILDILDSPITGYPDYASPLSAILRYDDGVKWFYSNYIQLYYEENNLGNPLRYYYIDIGGDIWGTRNPLFNYEVIEPDTLQRFNIDIIELIIHSIDRDKYVDMYVDEYYIENRRCYQQKSYPHSIFIYGYDKEKEIFYTLAYDKQLRYQHIETPFDQIRAGYEKKKKSQFFNNNTVNIMSVNEVRKEYEFNIQTVIAQLKEYLMGQDTSKRYETCFNSHNFYFGMNVYEPLRMHLKAIHQYNWNWNIIKPLYVLCEHKQLMVKRLDYLVETGYLIEGNPYKTGYQEIASIAEDAKMLFLIYAKKRSEHTLQQVLDKLDKIEIKEREILALLIKDLEERSIKTEHTENTQYASRQLLKGLFTLEDNYTEEVHIKWLMNMKAVKKEGFIGILDSDTIVTIKDKIPIIIKVDENGNIYYIDNECWVNVLNAHLMQISVELTIDLKTQQYELKILEGNGVLKQVSEIKFNKNALPISNIGRMCLITESIHPFSISNLQISENKADTHRRVGN